MRLGLGFFTRGSRGIGESGGAIVGRTGSDDSVRVRGVHVSEIQVLLLLAWEMFPPGSGEGEESGF